MSKKYALALGLAAAWFVYKLVLAFNDPDELTEELVKEQIRRGV